MKVRTPSPLLIRASEDQMKMSLRGKGLKVIGNSERQEIRLELRVIQY
jgi:hypothetical protein